MASATTADIWRPLRNRRSLIVLAVLVVIGYISFGQWRSTTDSTPIAVGGGANTGGSGQAIAVGGAAGIPKIPIAGSTPGQGTFAFDAALDRDNHSLTHAQCDAAFPLLYHEIDRAREYWRKQQGEKKIGYEQVDLKWSGDGGMMVMIYNQQVR